MQIRIGACWERTCPRECKTYRCVVEGKRGIAVGQQMSAALSGKATVDAALKASQAAAEREMTKGGYYKK